MSRRNTALILVKTRAASLFQCHFWSQEPAPVTSLSHRSMWESARAQRASVSSVEATSQRRLYQWGRDPDSVKVPPGASESMQTNTKLFVPTGAHWVMFNVPGESRELSREYRPSRCSSTKPCKGRMISVKPAMEAPIRRQVSLIATFSSFLHWT